MDPNLLNQLLQLLNLITSSQQSQRPSGLSSGNNTGFAGLGGSGFAGLGGTGVGNSMAGYNMAGLAPQRAQGGYGGGYGGGAMAGYNMTGLAPQASLWGGNVGYGGIPGGAFGFGGGGASTGPNGQAAPTSAVPGPPDDFTAWGKFFSNQLRQLADQINPTKPSGSPPSDRSASRDSKSGGFRNS